MTSSMSVIEEIDNLSKVKKIMAMWQSGKELTDQQIDSIFTFLGSLAEKPSAEHLVIPSVPKSTRHTPKPDPSWK